MSVKSILKEAAAALKFNRQRSILTMVSLAWGVSCFVILYSYGEGFGFALNRAFRAVGHDLILMFGGQTSAQAGGERAGRRIRLDSPMWRRFGKPCRWWRPYLQRPFSGGPVWCADTARNGFRCGG